MSENSLATIPSAKAIQAMAAEFVPVLRELVTNGRHLTDEQIQGRAIYAALEHLNPITEVQTLVDQNGKTLGHMMGINGYRRKCQEQLDPGDEVSLEFVEIPPERMPKNSAYGYECRLRDGTSYKKWQRRLLEVGKAAREAMGVTSIDFKTLIEIVGPAPVFIGIGIFWQDEFNPYKDRNFPPQERAKKRAERNARTKRFPTEAPMIEVENDQAPLVIAKEGAVDAAFTENPHQDKSEEQILSEMGYESSDTDTIPQNGNGDFQEGQGATLDTQTPDIEQNNEKEVSTPTSDNPNLHETQSRPLNINSEHSSYPEIPADLQPVKSMKRAFTTKVLNALVDAQLADNTFDASGRLAYSALDEKTVTPDEAVRWTKYYQWARDHKVDAPIAGAYANKFYPQH